MMTFEELKDLTKAYDAIQIVHTEKDKITVEFTKKAESDSLEDLGYSFEVGM